MSYSSKKCINCHYFDSDKKHQYGGWECGLHKSGVNLDQPVKITYPSQQFCGDEFWISNIDKVRDRKLDKLGI